LDNAVLTMILREGWKLPTNQQAAELGCFSATENGPG